MHYLQTMQNTLTSSDIFVICMHAVIYSLLKLKDRFFCVPRAPYHSQHSSCRDLTTGDTMHNGHNNDYSKAQVQKASLFSPHS